MTKEIDDFREKRIALGFTPLQLATAWGICTGTILRYESGDVEISPDISRILSLEMELLAKPHIISDLTSSAAASHLEKIDNLVSELSRYGYIVSLAPVEPTT